MTSMFEAATPPPPPETDHVNFQDLIGELVLVKATGKDFKEFKEKKNGEEIVKRSRFTIGNVVVLSGEHIGKSFTNKYIFGAGLDRQLPLEMVTPKLGRVGRNLKEKNAPWQLETPSAEDSAVAQSYFDNGGTFPDSSAVVVAAPAAAPEKPKAPWEK